MPEQISKKEAGAKTILRRSLRREFMTRSDKQELMDLIRTKLQVLVPEASRQINPFMIELDNISIPDRKKYLDKISDRISEFLLKQISVEILENRLHTESANSRKGVELNRLLVAVPDGRDVELHIPITFFGGLKESHQFWDLFREGLQNLANLIRGGDTRFRQVRKIKGISHLIYGRKQKFEDFGFTVVLSNAKERLGYAEMTREKLLEKYS